MRGTILHFDGTQGIVSSGGTQHRFTLEQWRSDVPPETGQQVEIVLAGEEVRSVTKIETTQIAQEKAIQYWGRARQIGQATYQEAGRMVTVAYGLFALLALFADTVRNIPITLPGLVNGFSWGDLLYPDRLNGGLGLLLVFLAILSIALPVFWRDARASLAYTLPLVVTVIGLYHLITAISDVSSLAGGFDSRLGDSIREHAFQSITLWFWLMVLAAGYLAWVGFQRYRRNKSSSIA
jgi:hypothetical protein